MYDYYVCTREQMVQCLCSKCAENLEKNIIKISRSGILSIIWHFGNEKKEITISAKHNSAQVLYPSNTKIKLESEKDNLKITFPPSLAAAIIEIN